MFESLDFSYAFGQPSVSAKFRSELSDFIVDEHLDFAPSGEGEHYFLKIRKHGENTAWVAEKLAKYFQVKDFDVGYCGMKDRYAITTQWFSVYLPAAKNIEFSADAIDANIDVLEQSFHKQKLRRGMHASNDFQITLRDIEPSSDLTHRLEKIAECGVPNYFGEQRFGRDGNNLEQVTRWVDTGRLPKSRAKKSIVMSAARSYLFNSLLSSRVTSGNWNTPIEGDANLDELPTAPLWGRGRSSASADAQVLEEKLLAPFAALCERLEHCGLSQERRSLVLKPNNFCWEFASNMLKLNFSLAPGYYATSVLRELVLLENQSLLNRSADHQESVN